jgi:F420-dependent oxidoreductase-like protein
MDLAVHIVRFDFPGGPATIGKELAATARACDDAGVAEISLMDHYFQIEHAGAADDPMLEGYTGLGYLAAHTEHARLMLLVTGVTYRHPGLLAKIVTTLDVLSNGRATLGIGAAWYDREHRGLGVPFPPVAERFERLEEALQICQQMWSDDNGPYAGKHYQLTETLCSPRPISRPHPPIVIGGAGERKTLRLVAQYADACNIFAVSPDFVAGKLDVLRRHCDEVGRDHRTVAKTILDVSGSVERGPAAFAEAMQTYADLGVDTVHVMPSGGDQRAWVEKYCAPAVEAIRDLSQS